MRQIAWIALGGASGAVLRHAVDRVITSFTNAAFPVGILVVNVTGSFGLGLLIASLDSRPGFDPALRAGLVVGVLGSYTTFSTWTVDSLRLIEQGSRLAGGLNLTLSVALGIAGGLAGLALGKALT